MCLRRHFRLNSAPFTFGPYIQLSKSWKLNARVPSQHWSNGGAAGCDENSHLGVEMEVGVQKLKNGVADLPRWAMDFVAYSAFSRSTFQVLRPLWMSHNRTPC